MKIQIGKLYKNKTLKYILPMLKKHYDDTLITLLNSVSILATGVGDYLISQNLNQHVFILVDTKTNPRIFVDLINYIMGQDYFENDYPFDNILTGRIHMVVFRLPEDIISTFMKGQYSILYDFNDALDFIKDADAFNVVIKSNTQKPKFLERIKVGFQAENGQAVCQLTLDEIGDRELDVPPEMKNEFFNHREPID